MNPLASAIAWSTALFFAILACIEVGYRIGDRSCKRHPELSHEGLGAIEAAVFALLGLLLGFSFAGATSHLAARRQLIVQEANAIGTAYLRLDLLPAAEQPEMRGMFRQYLDARLRMYEELPDWASADQQLALAKQLQQEIWSRALTASRGDQTHDTARLLIPALNEMFDVTTARTVALHTRLPSLIFSLLVAVALVSGLLAGFGMAKRRRRAWLHMLLFAIAISVTIYALLDMEDPRVGLIQLHSADNALLNLRDSIR